ncbi:MAG: tail fiber domain-containing protein [Candidatus Delongbacteria bacterium]|nr:tail fiber domain-containing protein [Candidatus Delongbacteria bacterium]
MIYQKHIVFILVVILFSIQVKATPLFEIKDESNYTVLEVTTDGLRVFNQGDTLMVISSSEIKAFIENSKDRGLSRSFSVTTSASKGQGDVVNIAGDGLRVYSDNTNLMDITTGNITAYIDTSYSFNVTSTGAGKLETDVLEVNSDETKMREGAVGEHYSDFSPENVFLGLNTGKVNVVNGMSGIDNVFLGNSSGENNWGGSANVFLGNLAGYENVVGTTNIMIGKESGYNNIEGHSNIYIGHRSGYTSPYGNDNVCLGAFSGLYMTGFDNNNNVLIGANSGRNIAGEGNICLGYSSGSNETGSNKLYIENSDSSTPLIYGEFDNDFVTINGELNVVGSPTLGSLMIAPSEATSGDDAEIVLAEDNDGTYNMSMKYDGGLNRLEWWAEGNAISYGPLMYLSYNTSGGIPYLSSGFLRPISDNVFDLGASTLRWDDVFATNGVIQTSDKRQKSDIKDIEYGLNTVLKMRPVTYFWKDKPERGRKVGLIAQELLEIVPEIVDVGEDEEHTLGLNYSELTPILIKAIQDQKEEIELMKKEMKIQNDRIEKLEMLKSKLSN